MGDHSPAFDVDLLQCGQMQDPSLSLRSTPDHLRPPLVIDEDQPSAHDQSNEDCALEVAVRDETPFYERPSCRYQLSWQPHSVASTALSIGAASQSADFTWARPSHDIDDFRSSSTRPSLHVEHPTQQTSYASYQYHHHDYQPDRFRPGTLYSYQYPLDGLHHPPRCSSTASTVSSTASCPDFADFNLHSPAMQMYFAEQQQTQFTQLHPQWQQYQHFSNAQFKQELCYDPRPAQAASSISQCPLEFKPDMTSTPKIKTLLPTGQFSPEKESELCSFFQLCPYPTRDSKKRMSASLQLPYTSIQAWFLKKRKAVYKKLLNKNFKNMSREEVELTRQFLKRRKNNISTE